MSSSGSSSRRSARGKSSLLFPIIGMIIGFIAALFLLRELDIFEGDPAPIGLQVNESCEYPVGSYFDQLCNLVARATVEVQTAIDRETAAQCAEQENVCRLHRENLRQGLPTSERFRDALFDLEPPKHADDWHQRYLRAVAFLHSGYNAQFTALQDNNRDAFLSAHEQTLEAASDAAALFEDFQVAFTDERAP
ncbi:MAG: hypothetical protein F4066_06715 [Chloroflexi bacterium]|nr:hypothetical protein [Chloroflexota bacterium]MYF80601.1 hypothetical protein [Chloroflexota bacterium]MYI04537.1 hypothetical protein [Chloroflexota bacterium]